MTNPYPTHISDHCEWINAETYSNDQPVMLRIRPDLKKFEGKNAFPEKLVFTWEFGDTKEFAGLPSDEQYDQMRPFEDALVAALEGGRSAIFAYAHTGHGICELHFYITSVDEIKPDLDPLLNHFPGLPLKIESYGDVEWLQYMSLVQRLQ